MSAARRPSASGVFAVCLSFALSGTVEAATLESSERAAGPASEKPEEVTTDEGARPASEMGAAAAAPTRAPAPSGSTLDTPLGGGYWGPLGKAPPAPPDGAWQRTTGLVILPLGILRAGAGALSVYASQPPRCEAWLDGNDTTCTGLRRYGYWGLAFGAAMAVAGASFLVLGVVKGRRYAEWETKWSLGGSAAPGAVRLRLRVAF